jgi:alkylation response protein AidB-like acyl-CoA dehydrogenase
LTYFLFPLDAPGVAVRPIPQLDGEPGFAEIFFDEVFVPDQDVLGTPGDGWRIAMSTTSNERGLSLRAPGRFCAAVDRLVRLWQAGNGAADPHCTQRMVDVWIAAQAYRAYTWGTVTRIADGGDLGAAGSVNKVFWSELDIAIHETALDLLGPGGEVRGPGSAEDGRWSDGYLFSLAGPIYAGTNEIQRDIIAERLLGLPRGAR